MTDGSLVAIIANKRQILAAPSIYPERSAIKESPAKRVHKSRLRLVRNSEITDETGKMEN